MTPLRMLVALGVALSLSACAGLDTATRNATLDPQGLSHGGLTYGGLAQGGLSQPAQPASVAVPSVHVVDYRVRVSRDLVVSEANLYFPIGDIVWRGDAPGDRHAQVAAIFDDALRSAIPTVRGALPVVAEIDLERFHALTEKARYTVGGVHAIRFTLTLTDPVSGAVVQAPRVIEASLRAYGGSKAIAAEQRGLGQRVRITRHLANVIATELTRPGSVTGTVTDYVAGLEPGPLKI